MITRHGLDAAGRKEAADLLGHYFRLTAVGPDPADPRPLAEQIHDVKTRIEELTDPHLD